MKGLGQCGQRKAISMAVYHVSTSSCLSLPNIRKQFL